MVAIEIDYYFDEDDKQWMFRLTSNGYTVKLLPFHTHGEVEVVSLALAVNKLTETVKKDERYNKKIEQLVEPGKPHIVLSDWNFTDCDDECLT